MFSSIDTRHRINPDPLRSGQNFARKAIVSEDGTVRLPARLGLGMAPVHILDITQNQNAESVVNITNAAIGTVAQAAFRASSDTSSMEILALGSGFTANGTYVASSGVLASPYNMVLAFGAGGGATALKFSNGTTELARLLSNGNFLINQTGDGGNKLQVNGSVGIGPGAGRIISSGASGVPNASYVDLDTRSNGASFTGLLCISSARAANASVRTNAVYAWAARGTATDASAILTSGNGPSGAQAFSLTVPVAGVIRATNTDANPSTIYMTWIGTNGG